MLDQPSSDSIRNLFVMNFSGDEGTFDREKAVTTAQNIVFAAFYINFDQLRYRSATRHEIVQRDCRYINHLSASEDGALSVYLDAAMCPVLSPAPKQDSTGGIGPHRGRNDSKSSCQVIAVPVFPQRFRVPRVRFECDHLPVRTHEACHSKRNTSHVSSDVIDDHSWKDHRPQCILQSRFVLSPPKSGLIWKLQPHPNPLRHS